jgi:hypothetical protein
MENVAAPVPEPQVCNARRHKIQDCAKMFKNISRDMQEFFAQCNVIIFARREIKLYGGLNSVVLKLFQFTPYQQRIMGYRWTQLVGCCWRRCRSRNALRLRRLQLRCSPLIAFTD